MAKSTNAKARSQEVYNKKVAKLTKWYEHLQKERTKAPDKINENNKQPVKRAELKPLDYYIEKIKKPVNRG